MSNRDAAGLRHSRVSGQTKAPPNSTSIGNNVTVPCKIQRNYLPLVQQNLNCPQISKAGHILHFEQLWTRFHAHPHTPAHTRACLACVPLHVSHRQLQTPSNECNWSYFSQHVTAKLLSCAFHIWPSSASFCQSPCLLRTLLVPSSTL